MTERSDSEPDTGVSRRKFVAGGAAGWASVALAGCNALSPGDGTDTEEPTDTETEPDTETDTETPEPQPENYVVTDDILVGSDGSNPAGAGGFADSCSWTRTFTHGMQPIFKVGVYEPESGDQLGSDDITVAINVDDGPTEELAWSQDDDEEADPEWSGPVWDSGIPDDWEDEEITYTVEVSDSDANFTDVGLASGTIEVVEYTDPANNYVVTVENFRTSAHGVDDAGDFVQSCAPANTFAAGAEVGFDVGIWRGTDGALVGGTDEIVDEVLVAFEDLDTDLELAWATNDDDEPIPTDEWEVGEHAWVAVWEVPEDISEDVTYEVQISGVEGDEEFDQVGIYRNTVRII